MFYYLFDYIEKYYQFTGASVFKYISFRASFAFLFALLIATLFGKKFIVFLRSKQIGETVRALGLQEENQKKGTPTMGGIIIIIATIAPAILFCAFKNIYVVLLLVTTLWMGVIGFLDDYIKVFKKNKAGLQGKFKILGQFCLGILVGIVLYVHPSVFIQKKQTVAQITTQISHPSKMNKDRSHFKTIQNSLETTLPFLKNNTLNYRDIADFLGLGAWAWLLFIPIVILVIMAVSNGANLTDGLDGLAGGTSVIIVITLGIFAWLSGNAIFADYLNIIHIPDTGEMTVFIAGFAGALFGFLWYNAYPAQVFMGDTGSLTIGGIIAVIAFCVRKELLLPVLAAIFLVENLSVILQVGYFKYTRKKTGVGKRIFKMAPLHHHYQKCGFNESKIVTRFLIVGLFLSVITMVTFKLR